MTARTRILRCLVVVAGLGGVAAVAASAQDGATAAPLEDLEAGPSQIELTIWRSPAFRRRFAESFTAEVAIEPPVDARDLKVLEDTMGLMAENRIDDALERLEDGRSARASAALDFQAGNLFYVQGRLDEAADALEIAVGKHPKFRRAWVRLGDLEARRGNDAAAVAALTMAHELGANDPFTVGLLGWCHARLGNWVSAESAYRRAIMVDPDAFEWREGLADVLARQRREADAIALYESLIVERPADAGLWRRLGRARLAAGKPEEAAQDLEVVRELGGADAEVDRLLGDIYLARGLADLAVERHLGAMDEGETLDATAAFDAARTLARRGDLAPVNTLLAAVEARHLDRLDGDARAEYQRLVTMLAVRRSEEAETAAGLERIVEKDPLDGEALILLGQFHARQTDGLERAEYWFERAEGLTAFEVDARIRHAEALVARGRYPAAIDLLKQAQSLEPSDAVKAYLVEIEGYARNR